jgi:hypothetical protein
LLTDRANHPVAHEDFREVYTVSVIGFSDQIDWKAPAAQTTL